MKNDLCFIIDDVKLYEEKILFELEIPLVYICCDDLGNRYIVLCIEGDSDDIKYLISRISNNNLLKLIRKDISLRSCFVLNDTSYIVTPSDTIENDSVKLVNKSDLNDEFLPMLDMMLET